METRKGRETDPELSLWVTCNVIVISLDFIQSSWQPSGGGVLSPSYRWGSWSKEGKCLSKGHSLSEVELGSQPKPMCPQSSFIPHPNLPGQRKLLSQVCPVVPRHTSLILKWVQTHWLPQFHSKMSVDPLASWREEWFLPQLLHSPVWRVPPVPLSAFPIQLSVTENGATYTVHLVRVGSH